ncbi:HTH-type transcriptional repressor glcR [uncultured Ruminococcus sp.]|nr:HTH-type transcriptional repressor glcR [uncultured Ruminococcus sp.]
MVNVAKRSEREALLLQTLLTAKTLDTAQAMSLLNVSESTARRLFAELEQQNLVIRKYGGIQLAQNGPYDYSFEQSEQAMREEKQRIAQRAMELIECGDILFLDSGTTLQQLCAALACRLRDAELGNVTVVTNSLANLQLLSPYCTVILLGGEYRARRMDFAGFASNKFIQNFHFSKCFLGADGVTLEDGFMGTDADTSSLVELAVARSGDAVVLADSSKLGKRSFVCYAQPEDIGALVTDSGADAAFLDGLSGKLSRLIVA